MSQGWKALRSGRHYWGELQPGDKCLGTDPTKPPSSVEVAPEPEADLSDVIDATVALVVEAIGQGRTGDADDALRHAVHQGVSPTGLLLAFRDHLVDLREGGSAVGADVAGVDLPADQAEQVEVPVGEDGPAAEDQPDSTISDAPKRKPARRSAQGDG